MLKLDSLAIYICGPITGMEDKNTPAFNKAQRLLEEMGYTALNPARHENSEAETWAEYMRLGITDMLSCSAVLALPGWENSKGASMEVDIAKKLAIPVFYDIFEIIL